MRSPQCAWPTDAIACTCSVVTRTVRFPETSVAGETITTWAPKSAGAEAYRALAREVIHRFGA